MKTALASLAAVAAVSALLPAQADAARLQDPQDVMVLDLNACQRPAYPAAALAQGAAGKTTVEVQIGADGRVAEARVAASSGRTDLDDAALSGIRACTFDAVRANGQVPTGWLKTQYVWVPGAAAKRDAPDQAVHDSTFRRAMEGDPAAQNQLGVWAASGAYGKADIVEAAGWYRQAAEGGNAAAQNNLGVLYSRGVGVPRDLGQAAYWYEKAAVQGHGWGQANLAAVYQSGMAGETDLDKALYWMRRAAEGGLPAAQVGLGVLLMQRAASDAERAAAAAWLARAARQHLAGANYYLGRTFELGLGNPHDDVQAAALYRKAFGESGGRAETALGILLEAHRATAQAGEDATGLYRKAMQSRYPPAYYRYGLMLERDGDDAVATTVFRQAALLGDCNAAVKYLQGRQQPDGSAAADPIDAYIDGMAQRCPTTPTPAL